MTKLTKVLSTGAVAGFNINWAGCSTNNRICRRLYREYSADMGKGR